MSNKFLQNVTIRQINLIIVAFVILVIFLVVWIYIYVPIEGGLDKVSNELNEANKKIKSLELLLPADRNLESAVMGLEEQYGNLVRKIPDNEETSMKNLSEFAQALDLEIVSLQKQGTKWFLDEKNRKVTVEDKLCKILSVNMKLKGGYKAVIDLLSGLRQSIPAYIIVEKLKIENKAGMIDKLDVNLDFNIFLLSDNEK